MPVPQFINPGPFVTQTLYMSAGKGLVQSMVAIS